jgi:enoyl-CoA hydratase/carnithine racemase
VCSADAKFSIKEVDVGLCPDVGTLQRMERQVGSSSLVRELAFTGRVMGAAEALQCGFVSRVLGSREEALAHAFELAQEIATKSPVAVSGIKLNLNYARGRSVEDALKFQAVWSSVALQTKDLETGVQLAMGKLDPKTKTLFEKL